MNMTDALHDAIHSYFHLEHLAGILVVAVAGLGIGAAAGLWKKKHPLKMAAIPLVILGVLEIGIGSTLAMKSPGLSETVEDAIKKDPPGALATELDRQVQRKRAHRILNRGGLALLILATLFVLVFRRRKGVAGPALAIGLNVALMLGLLLLFEANRKDYARALGDQLSQSYVDDLSGRDEVDEEKAEPAKSEKQAPDGGRSNNRLP
jgi:hypothetical protein